MTGPICFARNDLRIEPRHLAAAPGVLKNGRNGSFEGLFRAACPLVYTAKAGTPRWIECGVRSPGGAGIEPDGVLGSVSRIC